MITVVAVALGIVLVSAVVVTIVDNARAATWRVVAAERRMRWENRRAAARLRTPYSIQR